jgi:hypothetical protein
VLAGTLLGITIASTSIYILGWYEIIIWRSRHR